MKRNFQKQMGVTLIEVIISIALIAIISVGVYNAYLLLIRQTKEGQVKQISTLLGKQISEEIKSVSDNKGIKQSTTESGVTLEFPDKIHFTQKEDSSYICEQYFNEKGEKEDSKSRYTAKIELIPRKTGDGNNVALDEISTSHVIYIIGINKQTKAVEALPDNLSNFEGNGTIKIEMKDKDSCTISTDLNTLGYYFDKGENKDKKPRIDLDLKYCKGKTTVTVDKETTDPLNLCILNNNNAEIENENDKENLYEYYRSNAGSKIGVLYDVNIAISDDRDNDESKKIFETNFVQNINIK